MASFLLAWAAAVQADSPPVVINELMWDQTEYVELYNPGEDVIDLGGWQLVRQKTAGDTSAIAAVLPEGATIEANGYFLIERNEGATAVDADLVVSSLMLSNMGERVQLLDATGAVVDMANDFDVPTPSKWWAGENTLEGVAMERVSPDTDGTQATAWQTSVGNIGERNGTPRAANSKPPMNTAPLAAVSGPASGLVGEELEFSADDSTDSDGDVLTYAWTFGDGSMGSGLNAAHVFAAAGAYTVQVTVSDGVLEDEAAMTVSITAPVYPRSLVINEVLPNPVGSDTAAEFIELRNTGSVAVELGGWQLDDAEGGSTPYTIPAGTSVAGGSLIVFERSETKLALNNTGDSVRLLDPNGEVAATFSYAGSVPEGQSYSRNTSGELVLSTTVTEGSSNVVTTASDESEEDEDEETEEADEGSEGEVAGATAKTVALKDVREEEAGTVIATEGVVSAPPGVLGKQIMYVSGSGIQVYFSRAAWPAIKLGDTVAVTGELSSVRGEARLKVAGADDLEVKASGSPPEAKIVATEEIDEALEGSLVTIQGEVTETDGDTFYVDDGSGAIKVYIAAATKIEKPPMQQGMAVTITGIVSETTSGYRLLPRFQEDVRMGRVAGLTSFPATGLELAGVFRSLLDIMGLPSLPWHTW